MSRSRSLLLLLATTLAAGSSALLLNCSPSSEEDLPSASDEIVGANNALGLGLTYNPDTGKVQATLPSPLGDGEQLFVRARRGNITFDSEAQLDCGSLSNALVRSPAQSLAGKTVYDGPAVPDELVKLVKFYDDERWYGGRETPEMLAELERGTDSILEACVMKDGAVKAKIQTNLAYAQDRGLDLQEQAGGTRGQALHPLAGNTQQQRYREGREYNTIDYANFCVQELGEIPFFKKDANGKYETFDCRDFVGSNNGHPQKVDGVEGAMIPLSVDDQPQTECSRGRSSHQSYDCVDKCDRGMWLTASVHTGLGTKASCQPGVTVTTGKNQEGTNWVLLCRKVEGGGNASMVKSKTFNDIAIIGSNPTTGKTCFFQNKENVGNDGSRVVHPGDVQKSSAIWPSKPSSYCTENCHAADPFVHSPWIDQAKLGDGHTIVPKMGERPDYPISNLSLPYKVINAQAQGFEISKQLVGEDVATCTTCHRVAGPAFAEFSEWATGTGDAYYSKITNTYKSFEHSHWMPPRVDLQGLNADNFDDSKWGKAVKHIRNCMDNPSDSSCQWAPTPVQ